MLFNTTSPETSHHAALARLPPCLYSRPGRHSAAAHRTSLAPCAPQRKTSKQMGEAACHSQHIAGVSYQLVPWMALSQPAQGTRPPRKRKAPSAGKPVLLGLCRTAQSQIVSEWSKPTSPPCVPMAHTSCAAGIRPGGSPHAPPSPCGCLPLLYPLAACWAQPAGAPSLGHGRQQQSKCGGRGAPLYHQSVRIPQSGSAAASGTAPAPLRGLPVGQS